MGNIGSHVDLTSSRKGHQAIRQRRGEWAEFINTFPAWSPRGVLVANGDFVPVIAWRDSALPRAVRGHSPVTPFPFPTRRIVRSAKLDRGIDEVYYPRHQRLAEALERVSQLTRSQ